MDSIDAEYLASLAIEHEFKIMIRMTTCLVPHEDVKNNKIEKV
jgi:hypothetical protein